MDLTYSENQILLRDSVNRFLSDHAAAGAGNADAPSLWPRFAELGWLAMPLPEAHGGLGEGPVETAILCEALGRHLVREPFVPRAVLGAGLLATAGTEEQQASRLPGVATGRERLALAHTEAGARNCLSHVATTARRNDNGWVLDGRKEAILGEAGANTLLVSARVAGDVRDESGIVVFLLPREAPGLRLEAQPTVDGAGAACATLSAVELSADALLGARDDAFVDLERAIEAAIVAWSWELVGIMEALLAATVAYTKQRVQFGKPLSVHQVLRHRMVDMSVACEESRSTALRASLLRMHPDRAVRSRAASAAKVKVGRSARFVAEQAVQTHGGMGVTDELAVGSYLKRVIVLESLFGSPDHHLRRFAALSARARIAC